MKKSVFNISRGILGMILFSTLGLSSFAQSSLQLNYRIQDISCNGSNDGLIVVEPIGGTAPFSYSWSDGSSETSIQNLGAGTYEVTVTDAALNEAQLTVTMAEPAAINITSVVSHVTTNGGSNGAIDATVSGAVGTYNVLWNTSETSEYIYNLTAGTYTIEVTDQNGCTASSSVQVNEPTSTVVGPFMNNFQPNIYTGTLNSSSSNLGSAYPNPSEGIVDFKIDDKSINKIMVYSSTGVLVKEIMRDELAMNHFDRGEYVVHYLMNGKVIETDKLVIK